MSAAPCQRNSVTSISVSSDKPKVHVTRYSPDAVTDGKYSGKEWDGPTWSAPEGEDSISWNEFLAAMKAGDVKVVDFVGNRSLVSISSPPVTVLRTCHLPTRPFPHQLPYSRGEHVHRSMLEHSACTYSHCSFVYACARKHTSHMCVWLRVYFMCGVCGQECT